MSDTEKNRSVLPANWGRTALLATAALLLAACSNGSSAETAQCSASGERAAALKPLAGGDVAAFTVADEPVPLPVFEITGRDGEKDSTADFAGKTVLLNLWATWCAPCVAEMPLLDDLAADLDGQVRVVTVSVDMQGAAVVEPFFAEHQLQNLPMWLDPQNELAFAFGGGPVLPLTVLYDAQGHEVWRVIGAYDWGSEQARAEIVDALAESGG